MSLQRRSSSCNYSRTRPAVFNLLCRSRTSAATSFGRTLMRIAYRKGSGGWWPYWRRSLSPSPRYADSCVVFGHCEKVMNLFGPAGWTCSAPPPHCRYSSLQSSSPFPCSPEAICTPPMYNGSFMCVCAHERAEPAGGVAQVEPDTVDGHALEPWICQRHSFSLCNLEDASPVRIGHTQAASNP